MHAPMKATMMLPSTPNEPKPSRPAKTPPNERTDEAHHDITNQPIAAASHHPAGEEASNRPDHQPEHNAERIERESQS